MNHFRTIPTVLAIVGGTLLAVPMLQAANDTPKKKRVIFFSPHASGNMHKTAIRKYVGAEGYEFVSYLHGAAENGATLENFYDEAMAHNYAVFVIVTHGAKDGFTIGECDDLDACGQVITNHEKDYGVAFTKSVYKKGISRIAEASGHKIDHSEIDHGLARFG